MAKKIVNVPEADAKKRKNADIGAEMEQVQKENFESFTKLKEMEAEAAKELEKWMEKDRDLPMADELGLGDVPDPTVIPKYLRRVGGGPDVMLIPDDKHPRWVRAIGRNPRISWRRTQGYRPLLYDDYCKDTVHDWERFGAEGYILNGDCILMVIDKRKKEALDAQKRKRDELYTSRSEEDFRETAKQIGVQTYITDERGRRRYA